MKKLLSFPLALLHHAQMMKMMEMAVIFPIFLLNNVNSE